LPTISSNLQDTHINVFADKVSEQPGSTLQHRRQIPS